MQKLLDRGVASRRGIMCAHREAPYRDAPRKHSLTESERATDRSIVLPLYPQMTTDELDYVCAALIYALG
jgi:dTDP-4-amino-4,6-dideoxygalactose transaminase